jgi:hypothetical protein
MNPSRSAPVDAYEDVVAVNREYVVQQVTWALRRLNGRALGRLFEACCDVQVASVAPTGLYLIRPRTPAP